MKRLEVAAVLAAVLFAWGSTAQAASGHGFAGSRGLPLHSLPHRVMPWVEGVTPPLENRLFDATYRVLPSHNVLKVYVFDAGGYQSAGIRFSGRVPHSTRDIPAAELDHEAVELIRTTFAQFPDVQTVDVWATIPVNAAQQTSVESTVFSVSADRTTYEAMRQGRSLSDTAFLDAFGRVWLAPEVPH